jgi:hypothetical protein
MQLEISWLRKSFKIGKKIEFLASTSTAKVMKVMQYLLSLIYQLFSERWVLLEAFHSLKQLSVCVMFLLPVKF